MQPRTPLRTRTREHFGRPTRRLLQERRPTSSWPIELVADVIVVTMQVLRSRARGALTRRAAASVFLSRVWPGPNVPTPRRGNQPGPLQPAPSMLCSACLPRCSNPTRKHSIRCVF